MVSTELPTDEFMRSDREFLTQLHAILEQNFSTQDFGVVHVASQMNVSERQLQRRVGTLTGQSPIQYLRCFRLNKSLDYLRDGVPIGKIALAVGFSSHAYFTSCFRARFGATPSQFQTGMIRIPNNGQPTVK
jgi:transcriptional regulator GlxA family with amidase domain